MAEALRQRLHDAGARVLFHQPHQRHQRVAVHDAVGVEHHHVAVVAAPAAAEVGHVAGLAPRAPAPPAVEHAPARTHRAVAEGLAQAFPGLLLGGAQRGVRGVRQHIDVEQRQRAGGGQRFTGGAQPGKHRGDVFVADRHDHGGARARARWARAAHAARCCARSPRSSTHAPISAVANPAPSQAEQQVTNNACSHHATDRLGRVRRATAVARPRPPAPPPAPAACGAAAGEAARCRWRRHAPGSACRATAQTAAHASDRTRAGGHRCSFDRRRRGRSGDNDGRGSSGRIHHGIRCMGKEPRGTRAQGASLDFGASRLPRPSDAVATGCRTGPTRPDKAVRSPLYAYFSSEVLPRNTG